MRRIRALSDKEAYGDSALGHTSIRVQRYWTTKRSVTVLSDIEMPGCTFGQSSVVSQCCRTKMCWVTALSDKERSVTALRDKEVLGYSAISRRTYFRTDNVRLHSYVRKRCQITAPSEKEV